PIKDSHIGRAASAIFLTATEVRCHAVYDALATDLASSDPRELVRLMDTALLDLKSEQAELPRNAQAERELAADREIVRALRQQIEQPDRPSAEALSEILERHQVQARHWQGVAEGVTRERSRRMMKKRQRARQALRE
ncbi:hypothetical protein, partial [Pseudomonas aeruginosa]|uniref:hypothetical protein n=1 Tax=Pseudomonas aeruginosa TaxID=287 RepID=UPI001C60BB09